MRSTDVFFRSAHFAVLLVGSALVVSCTGISGEGAIVHEAREVRPFQRVEVGSGIHLVIAAGPDQAVGVAAQWNIQPAIATDVSADTLHVDATDDFTTTDAIVVTVTTPGLDAIVLGGGAQARLDDFEAADLAVTVKGGARLTGTGSVDDLSVLVDGGSRADLSGLLAARAQVALDGGGQVTIAAREWVQGTAAGGARLTTVGGAAVDVVTSGGATVGSR